MLHGVQVGEVRPRNQGFGVVRAEDALGVGQVPLVQGGGGGHVAGRPVGAGQETARGQRVGGVRALQPAVGVNRAAGERRSPAS